MNARSTTIFNKFIIENILFQSRWSGDLTKPFYKYTSLRQTEFPNQETGRKSPIQEVQPKSFGPFSKINCKIDDVKHLMGHMYA